VTSAATDLAGARTWAARGRRRQPWPILPWVLIGPTALGIAAFSLYPTLATAYRSLFLQNQAVRVPRFVGLDNFLTLLVDDTFHRVLANTVLFLLGTVPTSVVLALALALVVNTTLRGIGLLRGAFFHPTVLPMVSAAAIWLFLYQPNFGLVNQALRLVGLGSPNWLGDANLVLPALMLMAVWKQTGYFMLFYLAGLQNLPPDVFEAAALDGASRWQQLRYMTIPLLSATTLFVTTVAAAGSMQMVDQLYIMTQGGPDNASNLLLFHIYETAFRFQNVGQANALTVILVALLLVFTVTNLRFSERRAHYED
jgi:sn-glycerol 3-phosphate transport system permease protein